jgi:hypothetical protein
VTGSIKSGATRIVLLIGGWAIKIPRFTHWNLFLCGLLANRQERMFGRLWCKDSRKLCPILFSLPGGFLVVMRRAEPMPESLFEILDIEAWKDCGDFVIPVENKISSFGLIDGAIVAVDYGS